GAEGIHALAFIPLMAGEKLIGKFMTYYDRPHQFRDEELALALALARQIGFGVERKRADEAKTRLAAFVESSEAAITTADLNGISTSWNRGAERLFGYRAEEVIGKPITLIVPPDRLDEEPQTLASIRHKQ